MLLHQVSVFSGIGIRTPTNRVRVCRATVTQYRFTTIDIIAEVSLFVNSLFEIFLSFFVFYILSSEILFPALHGIYLSNAV